MKIIDEMKAYFGSILGTRLEEILRERRDTPRKPCDVYGVYTYQGGSTLSLVVKDISRYGMQVQTYKKLDPGSFLMVSARSDARVFEKSRYESKDVYMTVLWCRGNDDEYAAGLQFSESLEKFSNSWLAFLLEKYGLTGDRMNYRRRSVRVSSEMPLTWRRLGGESHNSGTVLDISLDGVLIETERKIEARENLSLSIGPYKNLKPLICRAAVVHTVYSKQTKKTQAGLCFTGLDEEQTKLLRRYLADLYLIRNN